MSSISEKQRLRQIRKYFSNEVLPTAKKVLAARTTLFPGTTDPSLDTYYTARKNTPASPVDFEIAGCESPEQLAPALSKMWSAEGYPELSALAESMSRLARALHFAEEQADEVSPFIYVMF